MRFMSQILLNPLHPSMSREEVAVLLENKETMEGLGFTLEDFGGDLVVRAIPCDVTEEDAPACLSELAQQLQDGRKLDRETVYDDLLHTAALSPARARSRADSIRIPRKSRRWWQSSWPGTISSIAPMAVRCASP